MTNPKFAAGNSSFHAALKQKVKDYFGENNVATKGGRRLYIKAAVFVLVHVSIYLLLVLFRLPVWAALPACVLLGLSTAAIGFNVMHDGAHGSLSRRPLINKMSAMTLDFLGASSFMWHSKHNIIHHTFTNIDGVDDDIEAGILLRLAPTQQRYGIHRYQHLYFWGLYGLLYLAWVFYTDYKKYFLKRIGQTRIPKMSLTDHIVFWSFKLLHLFIYVLLPIYLQGFSRWLPGFLVYAVSCGFVLSIVFQLAHTISETSFPLAVQPANKMQDEWVLHQLKTTANFATGNKIITWLIGGLNFQIEHHLFPKISHIHYPALSRIVKEACVNSGNPYIEHKTVAGAIRSHQAYLKDLGRSY